MSKQMSRQQTKQERRRDRREEQRRRAEEQLRAARMRRRIIIGAIIVAILLIGYSGISIYRSYVAPKSTQGQSSTSPSAASSPVNTQVYPPVDNIACDVGEQNTYHVHAHLSLYINGAQVPIPQSLGIAPDQSCFYWLHTHDTSGVIHVEAPKKDVFTLGTFFHEWEEVFPQLQYPLQLDQTSGWTVYVNGKLYSGDFRKIPLDAHTLITMTYNTLGVTPDTQYNWGSL
jgi:hypothetical protein